MAKSQKAEIVKDAIRRFPDLGNLTIARYILATYGDLFENDLEKIRYSVRRITGHAGKKSRNIIDKSLLRDTPVKLPQTWRKIRTPYRLPPGLWLVLSDIHIPFHEPKALESAIQYGHSQKVDGIFLNGDIQDCSSVSYWPKERRDFNRELGLCIDFFDWLRQEFPEEKIVYKPGNHEYGLPRYFVRNAPELIGSPLAAMETVMGFETRRIEFLDYFQLVYAGMLPIIHGHEVRTITRSVNPARGLFLKAKTFAACSHCHQTSEHSTRELNGTLLTTWSFGCLCDLSPDYNPLGNDWNWGFGLANIEKSGDFEIVNKRILPSAQVV